MPILLDKVLKPKAKFEACPPLPLPIVKPSIIMSFLNITDPVISKLPLTINV